MAPVILMKYYLLALDTGSDKTLIPGIVSLTAQDGLDRIMLSRGSNQVVVKSVASARTNCFREIAVATLPRPFIAKSNE